MSPDFRGTSRVIKYWRVWLPWNSPSRFLTPTSPPCLTQSTKRTNASTDFSSPYLRDCSLALIIELRTHPKEIDAATLDQIAASTLPKIIGFEAHLTIDEAITGTEIVDNWEPEPEEDDFPDSDAFEAAYEKHYPKDGERKPWKRIMTNADLRPILTDILSWSINNKTYAMPTLDEPKHRITFSQDPNEQKKIERQEADHQDRIQRLREDIELVFGSTGTEVFETEHLLDIWKPPQNIEPDQIPEPYDGSFLDVTYIFTSSEYQMLMWIGHMRHYG